MSYAELTANKLYDQMQLGSLNEDVKKHLMILLLKSGIEDVRDGFVSEEIPSSYEQALSMGAVDIESARQDLHSYVDELSQEFNLR